MINTRFCNTGVCVCVFLTHYFCKHDQLVVVVVVVVVVCCCCCCLKKKKTKVLEISPK